MWDILRGGFINLISTDPEGALQISDMYLLRVHHFNGKIWEVTIGMWKKMSWNSPQCSMITIKMSPSIYGRQEFQKSDPSDVASITSS